jgi:hypothetical protein
MPLLKFDDNRELCLIWYHSGGIPEYAILSHTWGADGAEDEVTFQDLTNGYAKLTPCSHTLSGLSCLKTNSLPAQPA